jgi:hypothetical protein
MKLLGLQRPNRRKTGTKLGLTQFCKELPLPGNCSQIRHIAVKMKLAVVSHFWIQFCPSFVYREDPYC